jgi:outer membrane protein insertion porin family
MLRTTIFKKAGFLVLLFASFISVAAEAFVVKEIQLIGARRITLATVLSYIPLEVGESLTPRRQQDVMRALYATGFFRDVVLSRRGDTLVIRVKERPAIAEINVEGNKKLKKEDIDKAFDDVELTRGRIFNDHVLDEMQKELQRLYYSIGRYGMRMDTKVTPLTRNRVRIDIDIKEGKTAKIRQVAIIGNDSFPDKEILSTLEQGVPKWYAFLSSRNQYAKSKLGGDLEKLESFYLDRGYINYRLESVQVSISPDRKDIYITLNVHEGEQYKIRSVTVSADRDVNKESLLKIAEFYNVKGEFYSAAKVTSTTEYVDRLLGNQGYAFAETQMNPIIDEETREVDLEFAVKAGKRVYVRRIAFDGNERTRDEVYRRELRQMEGSSYIGDLIERSRVRIQRLPFVEEIEVETPEVPGTDELIDVVYSIKERLAGTFNIGMGYSGDDGVAFSTSLTHNNLFGGGNSLAVSLSSSDVVKSFNVSFTDPYHTQDGVSRSINAFMREIDTDKTLLSSYVVNSHGLGLRYGIPLSEYSFLSLGSTVSNTEIALSAASATSQEVSDFLAASGNDFDQLSVDMSYIHDTRNRSIFPEKGARYSVGINAAVPGSDLEYYKLDFNVDYYWPANWLWSRSVFYVKYNTAFGEGLGDLEELPFFEKYLLGGVRSLRGFEARSVAPKDSFGNPYGGDLRVAGSLEYIFPPLGKEASARAMMFYDFGNVYPTKQDFDADEFRTSIGVALQWLAPVGAMTFSYAKPLEYEKGSQNILGQRTGNDELEEFQFTVGGSF